MTDRKKTRRLTAAQLEGLIRHEHDGVGSRGLSLDESDTESRVELEAYVAKREPEPEAVS